jgi:hypothetical protein
MAVHPFPVPGQRSRHAAQNLRGQMRQQGAKVGTAHAKVTSDCSC